MSLSWQRRLGAIVVVVLLLTAILVPAASAEGLSRNNLSWSKAPANSGPQGCYVYYRVRKGDNLTIIARRYGVTVGQLQQWNNIWNPDRIYVGQTLVIVKPCPKPPPPPPPPAPKPPPCVSCQPVPPQGNWLATYYNNRDLAGPVVLERREAQIAHNWGWSSPAPNVFPDNFSARWTTNSNAQGGTYRITLRTDDGARVYVDGVLVLSAWQVQAVNTFQVDCVLSPGWHTWTVEYFEAEGVAEISFSTAKLQ